MAGRTYSEKQIEGYLVRRVKMLRGECWKLTGTIGIPDRLVMLPGGVTVFVEVKAAKGRLSKWQERRHSQMRALGTMVVVVWSRDGVDALLDEYGKGVRAYLSR